VRSRHLVVALAVAGASSVAGAQNVTYDLIIRGGRIVDGTGAPSYRADLAVSKGRIAMIGRPDTVRARRVIDATGLVVAPGFVDMMGQSADMFTRVPGDVAINLLSQGITTINAGEGESSAPQNAERARALGWSTMREYFRRLEAAGTPLNVAQTVGHTSVRQIVIGDSARQASPAELQRMRDLVEEAMQAYLTWEIELANQIKRDNTVAFGVGEASASH